MKELKFKKLSLVSEVNRAAREIKFSHRTMLVGRNHTGKSTVVKNIFRTLGCETKGKSERWDSLSTAVLEVEVNRVPYVFYRRANVFAIKNSETGELKVTTSYSEFSRILADLLDFQLVLATHQDSLAQATPPYLFLPYYIDQDGSWTHQWNSFEKLSQFSAWKKPLVAYVTGQRPNEFYVAKFDFSQAKSAVNNITQELNVLKSALNRVKKELPRPVVNLDVSRFKVEISELVALSTKIKVEQESLRKRAFEYAAKKESLTAQVAMARNALKELEGDLKYLTDGKAQSSITCPTCGSVHDNDFSARLELIDDSVSLRKIIGELEVELRDAERNLAEIQGKISRSSQRVRELEKTLLSKKGMLKLNDIVNSKSFAVVDNVFRGDISSLTAKLVQQQDNMNLLGGVVDKYKDPERLKAINEFYSERIELFASELGVQDLRDEIRRKPDSTMNASGSGLPRSLLAYQYAIIHTSKEKGDGKLFPIVVDSPNQQGQDKEHLAQMLKFIANRTPADQQLILAVEYVPDGFLFDGDIINLTEPFQLLRKDQYEFALSSLKGLVSSVSDAVDNLLDDQRTYSYDFE